MSPWGGRHFDLGLNTLTSGLGGSREIAFKLKVSMMLDIFLLKYCSRYLPLARF
jgi:hypothetical protein